MSENELYNFKVPLNIFRTYCNVLKKMGVELQNLLLRSLNVNLDDPVCKISWGVFVELNCLIALGSSRKEDEIDFYYRIFNSSNKEYVPHDELDEALNVFFGTKDESLFKDSQADQLSKASPQGSQFQSPNQS